MKLKEARETKKRFRRESWDNSKGFLYYNNDNLQKGDLYADDWELEPYAFYLLTDIEKKRFLSGTKHREYFADVMAALASEKLENLYPELIKKSEEAAAAFNFDGASVVELDVYTQQTFPTVLAALTKACGFGFIFRDGKLFVAPVMHVDSSANPKIDVLSDELVEHSEELEKYNQEISERCHDRFLIEKFLDQKLGNKMWNSGNVYMRNVFPEMLKDFLEFWNENQ